ncbi:MAG: hypothetical protein K2Z81_04530, partial [Cyanobacteria bacterium]|nr:hypothetical protein [Cyanobacteriota bacterium]
LVTVDVTSLFPAAPGSEERLREIASVPPPPLTMPPEPPSIPDLGDPTADKTGEIPAGVIPQAPREIEMWSGNSRAVVAVPTGN